MNIIQRILGTKEPAPAPVEVKEETTAETLALWMRYDPEGFVLKANIRAEFIDPFDHNFTVSFVGRETYTIHIANSSITGVLNQIIEEVEAQEFRTLAAARVVTNALICKRLGHFILSNEWPKTPGPSIYNKRFKYADKVSRFNPKCVATYRIEFKSRPKQ